MKTLPGSLLVLLCTLSAQNSQPHSIATLAQPFDTPLDKRVVDYGPSPYYDPAQKVRVLLTCLYFPAFVVKQYDEGQQGAEWLAILPIKKEKVPDCTRTHEMGEKVIEGAEWSGYFKGVKDSLVFFNADDGYGGGLPFVVYDSATGTKVFNDSAYDSSMWNQNTVNGPFDRLWVDRAQDGSFRLRYLRVVEADCDLHSEKAKCWESVEAKLSLKGTSMPICFGYEGISDHYDSMIAYPVEVSLDQHPVVKNVAGATKCWPVD